MGGRDVNVHKGTIVVMFSHESRAEARVQTIEDFARVGAPVAHAQVQHERPSQSGNRRTAQAALKVATQLIAPKVPEARGVLLIEDDVEPADTLVEWLEFLEHRHPHVTALYAPKVINQRELPERLQSFANGKSKKAPASVVRRIENVARWWGSQAVWFPLEFARALAIEPRLQHHERGMGPFDHALRTLLIERGATLWMAVPNVVQHRGYRNVVNPVKLPHSSASFVSAAPAPTLKGG